MLQFFWLGLVRSTQNFVCYSKKSVNRRPLLRLTIFFTNQNFLNCQQTSKIPSRIRGGLKIFCQATKSFVLWHEYPFFGSSYFAHMTISMTFLVIRKISHVRCREQGWKTKNWWVQKFRFIRCQTNSLVKIDSSTAFQFKNFWHS